MMFVNKYIKYLNDKTKNETLVDRLKIKFRPLIFPIELLLNKLDKNDIIFDIGCGSGQFSLLAVHFKEISNVYGVEVKKKLVDNANNLFRKYTNDIKYKFIEYNGSSMPNEITHCNKVFLNDVLHHIPKENQIIFLQEIFDKISEGTIFVLKDIDASSLLVYFNKLHELIFAGEIGKELRIDMAIKALEKIGYQIISTSKKNIAVYPHYIITCKK